MTSGKLKGDFSKHLATERKLINDDVYCYGKENAYKCILYHLSLNLKIARISYLDCVICFQYKNISITKFCQIFNLVFVLSILDFARFSNKMYPTNLFLSRF